MLKGLTIDNWVLFNDKPYLVTGIRISGKDVFVRTTYNSVYYHICLFKPVPLASDILAISGFDCIKDEPKEEWEYQGHTINSDGSNYWFEDKIEIHSLHELQNLFSIMGIECEFGVYTTPLTY